MAQDPRGWFADVLLVAGCLLLLVALYGGAAGLTRPLWTALLVGGFVVLPVGTWRPYRWHLTLWQIRHPRKAWWMWRVGRKIVAEYEAACEDARRSSEPRLMIAGTPLSAYTSTDCIPIRKEPTDARPH